MIRSYGDDCDGCGQTHSWSARTDRLFLFLEDAECNYVHTVCPHCGQAADRLAGPEAVLFLHHLGVPLQLGIFAPDIVSVAAAASTAEDRDLFVDIRP